ncbi:MAG TPA: chromosome segregation protein SMC [Verrucomicrobiota bacterium]|nr:chromosome segregation protein SMC [Verrucomicrobiales bacterium]HRI11551.1 chromosome segregation protein SMC [Verrucomicrobiota bacterium]
MYLKNLTALGFKSFADKTTLNFQRGMTAIVGPNGCGKSNVSDAIRWVLGEQSARALRGGEMADVIFNGTDGRKPLGMAEVSLTLGDVDAEQLRASGVPVDFNEVTVTRRVFRDGGSEYFINKVGCRLRDIQQLFAGTGVGKTSYSVMAQGNITQILSSKPDDRRLVFEEAAGITRFKQQKKEALRKLEHTEQNLLRVDDLIREVKRQIGSLQRQAGKARRYQAIATELQHLDTQLARHQFDVLQEEIQLRETELSRTKLEFEVGQETVMRLDDEVLQLRQQLSELEHTISEQQQHGLELKAAADRQEHQIEFNHQRLQELEDQNARAIHDITQSEERQSIAAQELEGVQERLAASQERVQTLRATLQEKQSALTAAERLVAEHQEALRQAQSRAFGAAQQLGRARNEINQLDLQKQGNLVRLEKLQAEQTALAEEGVRLDVRLNEFRAQVETEQLQVQTSRGTLEERQARLRALQQEINAAQVALDALIRQQAEKRSRLNVLEQLDTQHEGFGSGALAVLQHSQYVLGSLADKIRVPAEYVIPIEAALGHHLQLVLTEQPESAAVMLAELTASQKGRASIAALALATAGGPAVAEDPFAATSEENRPIPAVRCVECDAAVRPLIDALLGRTLIVRDLSVAAARFRESGAGFDFVTLSGELLTRQGIFTGGAQGSGKMPASILGRKNQIAELQSELAALAEQVNAASREKGARQSEQTSLQASLEQARTDLRQVEVTIASREGEFRALEGSKRALGQKLETVAYEFQSLTGSEAEGVSKRATLAAQVTEWESNEAQATARVSELTGQLEELRQQREGAAQAVSEARVQLATEEQLLASHGRQRPPLEARIRELIAVITRCRQEMNSFVERRGNFAASIAQSQREIERLTLERETLSTRLAELGTEKRFQEGEIQSREEQLRERRAQVSTLQSRRGQLEVELAQKGMAVEHLRERIQSKYQVSLDEVRSEAIKITFAEEGPAKVQMLSIEEMIAAGLSTDWDAVATQVAALQKRLDDIGPVNLVAIDEYEETEQRHTFLTTQYEDLVKAKQELVEVINKINGETKSMFLETFEKIRDNFRLMFVELFGGGKADIHLVEGEDPLEAGIDIVARPPGKQLQSITLLSGGEQTMTAVALLFSIYQVKPSPFCVLDELDAPLDESNINRFIRVLQRFLQQSQFVVITHNKRTISMADILYGVTMQEQGVSRIVSVKFESAESPAETPLDAEQMLDSPAPASVAADPISEEAEFVLVK